MATKFDISSSWIPYEGKPRWIIKPDLCHPHLKGIECWVILGKYHAVDVISGTIFLPSSGTPTFATEEGEECRDFGLYTDAYLYNIASVVPFHNGARTFMTRARFTNDGDAANCFGGRGSVTDERVQFSVSPSAAIRFNYGSLSGGNSLVELGGATQYRNEWANYAFVNEGVGGNFRAIYIDGLIRASSTGTCDGPDGTDWNTVFNLGRWHTNQYWSGYISDFRAYNRVLSAGEILNINNDYWAPFRQRTIAFVPSAFTVTTIASIHMGP